MGCFDSEPKRRREDFFDIGMIKKTAEGYMIADSVLAYAVKEYL